MRAWRGVLPVFDVLSPETLNVASGLLAASHLALTGRAKRLGTGARRNMEMRREVKRDEPGAPEATP